ncbi:HAMP domain-containing histidine kinase [Sulfurimonas sp. SAG-AH-194-L11]|nr:HAMP domain-containing sensor histidine kinase [Sulfurimonas sp. SAG-AH-194-L11]MDF1876738.1 HAMP domain-containing histidine kinase [Sulfurimonas sp. SAG-AH-194-L11]
MFLSGVGYVFTKNSIITNYDKERKILFYEIQMHASELLSSLMYEYSTQKEQLLQKHKLVASYIKTSKINPLELNLTKVLKQINDKTNAYNIYITDTDFIIRNTTFTKDIGFDLSFAKATFEEHLEHNTTGICTPLFEKFSKKFLSYTDSYVMSEGKRLGVLQVSYTYEKSSSLLLKVQKLLSKYPSLMDAKAYIMVDSGFVNDVILRDFTAYKPDLKEILEVIQSGENIKNKLLTRKLVINNFTKDGVSYSEMHIASKSAIFDDTEILYSLVLDNTNLENKLKNLNLFMFILIVLGSIAILVTFKLRKKEIKLSEQDRFVQSSMHEIKTPLSIITLNNELRELEFGVDEYSSEIDSAIKTLKTSYDDMSFTMTKDELSYPVELFTLGDVLQKRVEYFKSIANSKNKTIDFTLSGICRVSISQVELIRLIDNNLSNAIKYAKNNSTISIYLNNNELSFHTFSKPIQNTKAIFNKYVRENSVVGGHGLGLSIVQEIASKYEIKIKLTSSKTKGTIFAYIFKCHESDI